MVEKLENDIFSDTLEGQGPFNKFLVVSCTRNFSRFEGDKRVFVSIKKIGGS